jgi:3-oxoacyl-[acyl-carrier protein] reductase
MDDASGVMEFIPGSHLPQDSYDRDVRPFHKRTLSEHFLDMPSHLLDKRVKVPLKKGQFMLFHSALLHRSLPALGQNINRYSLVARLCLNSTEIPEALASKHDVQSYPYIYDSKNRFTDHVALVTGGSRGIGKAITEGLLAEGAKVIITGRNEQTLFETTELLKQKTGNHNVTYVLADASDENQMKQVLNQLNKDFGPPDCVFVNAATNKPTGSIIQLSADDWLGMVMSNIKATYYTCKLAAECMQTYGGNIITLGSGIGHEGAANNSAYAASKAMSWSLTQSLAKEVSQYGINVNEFIPGPVMTDMNPTASGSVWKKPEDVVAMALQLACQNLSFGVTGQSFSLKRC